MKSFYVASLLLTASLSPALAQVGGAGMSGPGAGVAGMMSDGSNATLPTARDNLGGLWNFDPVKDHGAPTDGTSDATTAIQASLSNCAAAGGGNIILRQGTFIAAGLSWPDFCYLRGQGRDSTVLKLKNGSNTFLLASSNYITNSTTNQSIPGLVRHHDRLQ